MRKWLYIALAGVAALGLLASLLNPGQAAGQVKMVDDGITLLPATIPVNLDLQQRVLTSLAAAAPDRGIFVYSITDVSSQAGYYYVSVAGLPQGADTMRLDNAIWLGNVVLAEDSTEPGTVNDLTPTQPQQQPPALGIGGSGNILPFRDGTQAQYGVLGVHNCGFSLNGWYAVDLFPTENMIYSTQAGNTSYVCRDGTQVALRIGDYLYTHIVDTGQAIGQSYAQGAAIGGMVPGTYDATCGYADQQPDAYHVHFCFIPDSSGNWQADGYTINIAGAGSAAWVKGEDTVDPTEILTADWQNAGVLPGPTAGNNFWDGIASGIVQAAGAVVPAFPEHEAQDIAEKMETQTTPALALVYIFMLSNFDLTLTIWAIGIILALEAIRLVYAAWMWVKRAIPVIG